MRMTTMLATALCACAALGQTTNTNAVRKPTPEERSAAFAKLSPEEQEARFNARMKKVGGLIERPGTGVVAVVNCQVAVSEQGVREMFMLSSSCPIKIPFRCFKETEAFSVATASARLAAKGTRLGIFLVDDPSLPMTLCAMEAGWGVVNVAPLKADSPKPRLLFQRLNKLFTRVATVVFGGAHESVPFSAMQGVTSLADLDAMGAFAIAPQGLTMMSDHLPKLGVTFPYLTTYKRACREGWAPAPTNDIQKAVWEKVKADKERGPTNPITIPPPNAKK